MAKDLKAGDKVTWNYSGNTVHGTVKKVHKRDFELNGRNHRASAEDPQYEVVSENGGDPAVHKADALKRD